MPRLVAVLGYSTRHGEGLHPICAARLAAAESVSEEAAAVLFSGWSRRGHRPTEAELMDAAWRGPDVRRIADGDARTTAGNVRAVVAAAADLGATEVLLVTSSWHARRARMLARAALGPTVALDVVTPPASQPLHLVARELACLLAARVTIALRRAGRRSR